MASDEQLVLRVSRGDEGALQDLLQRYEKPLSAFLYRNTIGGDVDDLFQETWLRVVREAGRFDADRRFSTWLFQIAVNLCRDWYRRRRPTSGLEGEDPPAPDAIAPAEARLDAIRLLRLLPEPQREVMMLRYFHDLSEKQVAEIVGCPVGTVKSRMHQAMAQLSAWGRKEPA